MWNALQRRRPLQEAGAEPASEFVLQLDYPMSPKPRYGYGLPAHPRLMTRISEQRAAYADLLRQITAVASGVAAIPRTAEDAVSPRWDNGFFPPIDAVTLYGLIALRRPKTYVEVGSGESTRFARRAIEDLGLSTRIVSIDPMPRAEIDALCDEVIRLPFEDVDLALFAQLQAGDLVFHDGSHRIFQNSDTVVTFLDVLPRLAPGVALGVHDIYLPWDYPPEWVGRHYSEQYILAAYLLADCPWLRVLLPNHFIGHDQPLLGELRPLWPPTVVEGLPLHGEAFWLEACGAAAPAAAESAWDA